MRSLAPVDEALDIVTRQYLVSMAQNKLSLVVGQSSGEYQTDFVDDNVQLQAALDYAHSQGGGAVSIGSALKVSAVVTLYKDVVLIAGGATTPVSISATFASGVVFRENSGAADNLTIVNLYLDLSGKADVGGIHIYQGNFIFLDRVTVKNQSYGGTPANSKWTVRVGNYTSGSPAGTASHGALVRNLTIVNCDSGTFEQLLFVNQQDALIDRPYFEGNTNRLAYQLMLYVNNKNVVISSPHFENNNAHSIGMMESDGIQVTTLTVDLAADYKLLTFINTRNVRIRGLKGLNTVSNPGSPAFDFFDRTLGPDGFTQLIDDSENITIEDFDLDGWRSTAYCQLVGNVSGTDYTMSQKDIKFIRGTYKNQLVPFNLGQDSNLNNLHDWDFIEVLCGGWTGVSTGAWQLRGYSSNVAQMYGFRFRGCRQPPTSAVGASSAIRNIAMTVESIVDCDFGGTFTTYGAVSSTSGGQYNRIANVKGINPIGRFIAGNSGSSLTLSRSDGSIQEVTLTANASLTFAAGAIHGDELTILYTQDSTGGRQPTLPANVKQRGGLGLLSAGDTEIIKYSWNAGAAQWQEVSRGGTRMAPRTLAIAQSAHGFTVGNTVYFNGTQWAKGLASNPITHLVVRVTDTNNFEVVSEGLVESLSGLTPGGVYFASQTTAGLLTMTEPSSGGQIWRPLLVAVSATSGYFHPPIGLPISSAGGPQALDLDTMRRRPFLYCDFLAANISNVDPFIGVAVASGTVNPPNFTSANHPGIVRGRSSTSANSGYYIGSNTAMLQLGGGEVFEACFYISTLTGSTHRLGFLDTASSSDASNGAYVEINSSGVVTGKTAKASTRSSSVSNTTVALSTWYRVRITVNADATQVNFAIYSDTGTLVWTDSLTTNIPTASTGIGCIGTNSGATAADLYHLDFMAFTVNKDRVR